MLFSSTTFLYLFLPMVLFFDFVVFRKSRFLQNAFLLLASLFFYAWGEPRFVLVMMLSIVINWFFGLLVSKRQTHESLAKAILALTILFNLWVLFRFKYLGFAAWVTSQLSGKTLLIPEIALPIGISFFTFQAMSYVIDVYRGNGKVQTNLLYVGLYISFFPQLIAGPIVRYETIADEIQNRKETVDDFFNGFARFVFGLAKKVLLANDFAVLADIVFNGVKSGQSCSVLFSWLGAVAYTLQIYFDFSGYSDMAIGLGRMFGFHYPENFNYPYISTSITEFWHRWHISLGSWFRDYIYIPLGGNRRGKARQIFNLFIIWFLTGLWHGANFTFVVWGLMYFVLLLLEKLTGLGKTPASVIATAGKRIYTLFFVVMGWVIFRCETIGDAVAFLKSLFGLNDNTVLDGVFIGWFKQNLILILIGVVLSTPLFRILGEKAKNNQFFGWVKPVILAALFVLSVASLVSNTYNPFIYYNF